MSRFQSICLALFCTVLVLVGAVVALLYQPSLTTAAAQRVLHALKNTMQADVQCGQLSIDPLKGHVTLQKIQVSPLGHSEPPIFQAQRLEIQISRWALLRRELRISRLEVVAPIMRGAHRGGGRYNWDALFPAKGSDEKPTRDGAAFVLDSMTISGGALHYDDPERQVHLSISPISSHLRLNSGQKTARGSIEAGHGSLTMSQERWPLESFRLRFNTRGSKTTLSEVDIKPQGVRLSGRGEIVSQEGAPPTLRIDGHVATDLAELPAWRAWEELSLRGRINIEWNLRGNTQKPTLALELRGQKIQSSYTPAADIGLKAYASTQSVRLEALKVKIAGGRMLGRGTLPLTQNHPGDLTLRMTDISLPQLARGAEVPIPEGLNALLNAKLSFLGSGTAPEMWRGKGEFRVNGRMKRGPCFTDYQVHSDLNIAGRSLILKHCEGRALGGVVVSKLKITAPPASAPTFETSGTLSGFELDRVSPFLEQPLPLMGHFSGDFMLKGQAAAASWRGAGGLKFAGRLKSSPRERGAPIPLILHTKWRVNDQMLQLKSACDDLLGGKMTLAAQVPFVEPAQRVQGHLQMSGVSLSSASVLLPGIPKGLNGSLNLAADIRGRQFSLQSLEARVFDGRFVTQGQALLDAPVRYQFAARAEQMHLGQIQKTFNASGAPLSGRLQAVFDIRGQGDNFLIKGPLKFAGAAHLPHPEVPGTPLNVPVKGETRLTISPSEFVIQPSTLQIADLQGRAEGTVRRRGNSSLTFQMQASTLDRVAKIIAVDSLSGDGVKMNGRIFGPPNALKLRATLGAKRMAYGAHALHALSGKVTASLAQELLVIGDLTGEKTDAGSVRIDRWHLPFRYQAPAERLTTGTIVVPAFQARLADGRIDGRGRYSLGGREVSVEVQSKNLTLGLLLPPEALDNVPANTPISLKADARGKVSQLQGNLAIHVAGFHHRGHAFGPSLLDLKSNERAVRMRGSLFGRQARLNGTFYPRRGDAELQLEAPDFRMAPILAAVPSRWQRNIQWPRDGHISGRISLKGNLSQPEKAQGSVEIADFRLDYPELVIRNESPWHLSMADRQLHFESFKMRGANTRAAIQGTLGLGGTSDLSLDALIDLKTLEKLAPAQFAGASGRLKMDGVLRGRWDDKSLNGALNIREGELETRNLPQPIHDLQVALRVTPNQISLDAFQANFGQTGRMQATGGARLDEDSRPVAANLQFNAQEMALRIPGFEAVANADLAYLWEPSKSSLDGQIRVLEGAYTENIDLARKLTTRKRVRSSSSAMLANPSIRDTLLRVQLALPEQFFVRNNVVQGELRGDVLVLGTPANPALVGRVETRDTEVTFQDRIYVLDAGTIDFIDPHRLVPYLNLSARAAIQGIDVRVLANGTPDKLRLELNSTPAMSQTDILTLIATGKTGKELGETGGGGLATASNFLLDQVAGGVARGITEQGVVDMVKVKPGSVDPASPGGASFTVGKRINEKLTVTYTQDITAPAGQTPGRIMIFDYLLTDAIVLKLEQDLGGGFNASARYRLPIR
ncbi:MAG: translocation/assembly module TamB domain-containing protein [Candidatus Sericytochromatia bacterium]|nr:translocation/assembly module TamB domain-containing protein [Candidatus Sericytochromatia bacterium]